MMKFCDCAINESMKSTHDVFQHGALLIKGKEIISVGHNNQFYHAEELAILRCRHRVLYDPKGTRQ